MGLREYPDLNSFLQSVQTLRAEQRDLANRVMEDGARCTKMTMQMRAAPGGSRADAQQQWVALADESRALTQLTRAADRQEEIVRSFLARVAPTLYRDILTLRYVNGYSWPAAAARLSELGHPYSIRHVQRLHGAALLAAQRVWDKEAAER